MTNPMELADILVKHIQTKYAQDIAIVAYYGSYARGDHHEKSDLDFFFIPDNNKNIRPSITFIIDDIGYDFWPISWERATRMASLEDNKTSVIADAKILYHRSQEDLKRFQTLQQKPAELSTPEHKKYATKQAMVLFKDAYMHLYNMGLPNPQIDSLKIEADKLITTIMDVLALLNQTYFSKSWISNTQEIAQLKIKPQNLLEHIHNIIHANTIDQIILHSKTLVFEMRQLILNQQNAIQEPESISETFTGFYEEFKSYFNKIIVACDNNNFDQAWGLALGLQNTLAIVLTHTETNNTFNDFNTYGELKSIFQKHKLPELTTNLHPDQLPKLRTTVIALDHAFQNLLQSKSISFNIFQDTQDFREFIEANL